ncbi:Ubiquinone biosynthesis O-methyltransferase, mitochondrial [Baekduia alba]|uniref:class I SAM-dependent methyltransferase n=1 Tax=Baekduia alba TaxID=2997333 RepID=UPI0023415261|nr:class I SAM-dependent methyltransferase [Baekduia alba]WCB91940.1 Ubiquinone biosynthesis O-methyltransferase, mitochondrial [Baekduia alba]
MTTVGPYATLVAEHGLSESHRLVLEAVPDGARVLDVGCATGYLAAELGRRGCTVDGIEFDPDAAEQARAHCRAVVVGDLEAPFTHAEVERMLAGVKPDVIICADVLEHLRDPWSVLGWLAALLPPEGKAIISIPNIAHWTARRALLRGRFAYADYGLFDRTHLRFFTRDSARELARRAGFSVLRERPAGAPLPLESRVPPLRRVRDRCVRRYPELLALQFVLVLVPDQRP